MGGGREDGDHSLSIRVFQFIAASVVVVFRKRCVHVTPDSILREEFRGNEVKKPENGQFPTGELNTLKEISPWQITCLDSADLTVLLRTGTADSQWFQRKSSFLSIISIILAITCCFLSALRVNLSWFLLFEFL